jgi:hypothetical protein
MGRGTVALVWLVIAVGFGAAYGMGVTDGRKRAEGVAAERERDYQYRLDEACRILVRRAGGDDALDDVVSDGPATHAADGETLARARPLPPPKPGAGSIQSAFASRER